MSQWMKYYFYVTNFALLADDEEGQSLAEYGLIIALVAVVAIAAVTALGGGVTSTLATLTAKLGGAAVAP